MWDAIWINAGVATMADDGYGMIANGAVAGAGGRIVWVGPAAALPAAPNELAAIVHDEGGRLLTPRLVDCHTHIVHAGERCSDFELRLKGGTREDIARVGGGVRGTMYTTRATSDEALY